MKMEAVLSSETMVRRRINQQSPSGPPAAPHHSSRGHLWESAHAIAVNCSAGSFCAPQAQSMALELCRSSESADRRLIDSLF
jgi:hypothetical protein